MTLLRRLLPGLALLLLAGCQAASAPLQIREPQLGPMPARGAPLAVTETGWADGRAYSAYMRGLESLREGDIARATDWFGEVIARDPTAVAPRLRLAALALLQGQREAAAQLLGGVDLDPEQLAPPLLEVYLNWAVQSAERERVETALRAAVRQEVLNPALLLQWVSREEARTSPGVLLAFIHELQAEDPDLPVLRCIEGHLQVRLGRYRTAVDALEECLGAYPEWLPGMLERGIVSELLDRPDEARLWYRRVLALEPGQSLAIWRLRGLDEGVPHAEMREQLAGLLAEVRVETALQLATQALRDGDALAARTALAALEPAERERPRVQVLLGVALELEGDLDSSFAAFEQAMTAPEGLVRRIAAMQWVRLLRLYRHDSWEAQVRHRYSEQPDPELAVALGLGLADDDIEQGRAFLREARTRWPGHAELVYRLGILHERQGDRAAALDKMEETIRVDPDHADALNFLGYSLAEVGRDLERAEQLIRRAVELKPQAGYILDSLGWVLFQQGRAEEALPWLEEALALEGEDPVILEHIGDARAVLGRDEAAREAYRQALEIVDDEETARRLREKIRRTYDR